MNGTKYTFFKMLNLYKNIRCFFCFIPTIVICVNIFLYNIFLYTLLHILLIFINENYKKLLSLLVATNDKGWMNKMSTGKKNRIASDVCVIVTLFQNLRLIFMF